MSLLQLRLKNCIQTILELEPCMKEKCEDSFDEEFTSLKKYLDQVDSMELAEEDVCRLENVTNIFLAELENAHCWQRPQARILH